MEYLCEVRETDEAVEIETDGTVTYHPYGTRLRDILPRMALAYTDKLYDYWVDDCGLLKHLDPNHNVRFPQQAAVGRFAVGTVVRMPKERHCGTCGCVQHGSTDTLIEPNRTCGNCGQTSKKLKCCARCHKVSYCNRACQRAAWTEHKKVCRPVSL